MENSDSSSSVDRTKVKLLGSYLVEASLLTQAQVDVVLADQEVTGVRFGEILVARGWVKEETIEYLMRKIILPEREADTRDIYQAGLSRQASKKPLEKQKARDELATAKQCFDDDDLINWIL
jgi:cytochrome oxidase assembly protein ShyY1